MVTQVQSSSPTEVFYPDTDGQPMANNTEQFRWIVVVQQNLEWLYANDPNVFIAGDLFWYPVEGRNNIVTAPDVMVVFGPAKGKRGSYQQWNEGGIAPQVVFEILSPCNTPVEMDKKLLFYERYGVEEYYIYDPDKNELRGWLRGEDGLDAIVDMANWISPRMGIRFDMSGNELKIYHADGREFVGYTEIAQRAEQEAQRAEQAEQQLQQTAQELEQERMRSQALIEKLRAAGIDPEQI